MPDKKKVIKSLETCSDVYYGATGACSSCSFSQSKNCFAELVYQTIELLKEQEPVKPIRINTNFEQSWKCGECGGLVNTYFKYCPYCGRSLRWGNEIPGI